MHDKDLINQLKSLKQIKPSTDWSNLTRADLLSHIDSSGGRDSLGLVSRFRKPDLPALLSWKFASAFATIALLIAGFALFNNTNTSVVQNDLHDQVTQAKQIASAKLTPTDALLVAQYLENVEKELAQEQEPAENEKNQDNETEPAEGQDENSKNNENEEKLNKTTQSIQVLTNIMEESKDSAEIVQNLKSTIVEFNNSCTDETLYQKVEELLDLGDIESLVDALHLAHGCSL